MESLDSKRTSSNGPHIVAKAWTDAAFKERLLKNGREAAAEIGISDVMYPSQAPPEGTVSSSFCNRSGELHAC